MIKIMTHGWNGEMGRVNTEIGKGDEKAAIGAGGGAYTASPNGYPGFYPI